MRNILIDADTGIDDSLAILYALNSPNLNVVGITTCFGNSGAMQSADNTLRLIKLSNCKYEVPVVIGADCGLDGTKSCAPAHIHGDNGIGNVILPESDQKPLNETAEDFIIRKAKELNGELIIVTTGRLTNLARAYQKEPNLTKMVKRVVAMGGCLYVPGNISGVAEANIGGDAMASDIVFRAGFNLFVVGLDVTMKTFIRKQDIENCLKYCKEENKKTVEYIRDALSFYFNFHKSDLGMMERSVTHDPLAVLIAEDMTLGKYEMIRAGVEYKSEDLKGMIVRDERFHSEMEHDEIGYCIDVDSDLAIRRLFSVFC